MRVAVTGALGLTGGAAVRALGRRGHDVVAVVRRDAPVDGATDVRRVDLDDTDALARSMAGADALLHVAGILLGDRLAAALAAGGPANVVIVSTASVYGHHAHAHVYRANEEAVRAVRPSVTVVRPTMIYGSSRDRNVHRVVEFARRWRFLPVIGEGKALVQPIHYADLAEALAACVDRRPGGTVDAGGATRVSLMDAARTILRAVGAPDRVVRVPYAGAIALATVADLGIRSRWRDRVRRTREDRVVDNARLLEATGVAPRAFAAGLADMLRESAAAR